MVRLLYKTADGKGCVVPSETTKFPKYCAFFNEAYRREREQQARKPEVAVLSCEELEKLYDHTNWQSPYEAQRTNLLIMCFTLGQRPESIEALCVGNFHRIPTADNSLEISVKFANMKNLQPKQENVGKPAHEQLILPHPNVKLCAVAAWQRQLKLMPAADLSNPNACIWRSMRVWTTSTEDVVDPATYYSFKGAAAWASKVLERKVTFKDCSRRPLVTRLTDAMGVVAAAKVVGIRPNTVQRYHKADRYDLQRQAATVLNQVFFLGGRWTKT